MDDKKKIQYLFIKYFNNRASEAEREEVQNWIGESDKNKKEFEAYRRMWEKSKNLIISDRVNVESALHTTKKRIRFSIKKRKVISILRQAAAVLVIGIVFSIVYNNLFINHNKISESVDKIYREVKTSNGTQSSLILADGTKVWLNSGSKLRFPLSFQGEDRRSVELVGEGFFEVAKNVEKPFIVKTSSIDVKVLGTKFNVSAYENDDDVTVALLEGKVELGKNYDGGYHRLLGLLPNEVALFNKKEQLLSYSKIQSEERFTAWIDGRIVFSNDPIDKLESRLENWYNVEIEIEGSSLNDYRFTATFIDESLEQIIKLLAISSPMEYEIEPSRKLSDNTYTKRKIILKEK
jgi:ferric-dicitrate binding protein FerR (iron transport regulator)